MSSKWFLFVLLLTSINLCRSQIDFVDSASTSNQAFDEWESRKYIPYKSKDKQYLLKANAIDTNNRIVLDCIYNEITNDFGYYGALNGKHGLVGFFGDTLISFKEDTIYFRSSFILCQDSNSFTVLSSPMNESTYSFEADSIFIYDNYIYHYKNGNVGLVNESFLIPAEYEAITPLNCLVANLNFSNQSIETHFKVVTKSESLQIIDGNNKKLLPKNVSEIQCYHYGIISFFDTHWKYLNLSNHEVINNDGNDVVFYSNSMYKKYNKDKSKSILISHDKKFQGRYNDYFTLNNNSIAVLKKGKVGVIDYDSERIILPLEYDQIKPTKRSEYFKTYKDLKCGITKVGGKTLISHKYSNIIDTGHEEIYVVINNNKGGVITIDDRLLLNLVYDQILVQPKAIVCRVGNSFGLFDLNGKQIVPISYSNYSTRSINGNNIYLFYNSESQIYIANHEGFIGNQPVSHIEFGEDLIKTYKGKSIYVSVLNTDGEIEETNEYRNLNSFIIPGDLRMGRFPKSSWSVDELEENQQTGLYGRRNLIKYGFSHKPKYTTLRYSRNERPYGQLQKQMKQIEIIPGIIVENKRYFNDISSIGVYSPFLLNDNAFNPSTDLFLQHTSDKYMLQDTLGTLKVVDYANLTFSEDYPLNEFVYSKSIVTGAKFHFHSNQVEITTIENSDLSLSDYFDWLNILGVYKPNISDLKRILDPHLGVKFVNSTVIVSHPSHWQNKNLNLDFVNPVYYKDCRVLNSIKALFYKDSDYSGTISKFHKIYSVDNKEKASEPIIKNVANVKELNYTLEDRLLVQPSQTMEFKVHRDYPEFKFYKNNHLVDYNNGLITIKIKDSNYVLMKPNHQIAFDCLEKVTHVHGVFFNIKEIGGESERIINVRTKEVVFSDVLGVEQFNQDYFVITKIVDNQKLYTLVNQDMKVLKTFSKIIRPYQDEYIWINYIDNVLLNIKNNNIDTLNYDKHKLFPNGFILFEKDNRKFVRLFGQKEFIKVDDEANYVNFGDRLYGESNDRHFYIDQLLDVNNLKRKASIEVLKNKYLMQSNNKETVLYNDNHDELYASTNEELSFNVASSYISFYDEDTLKYLTNSDEITTSYNRAISQSLYNSEYTLNITEKGAGLIIDGEIVLKDVYKSIKILNKDEFIVETNDYQKLYNSNLKPVGIEGAEIFPISNTDYYLIKNGSFQYVVKNGEILINNIQFWN